MTPGPSFSKNGNRGPNKFERRADIIDAVRAFFKEEGFLEVDTPCLVDLPGMEPYLDPLKTEKINARGKNKDAYLITSPEYAMKKLLVDGFEKIYTICSCFRNGETPSSLHNTEFKMLEWYRAEADYTDIMKDTENLIFTVNKQITGNDYLEYQGKKIDLTPPWPRTKHTGNELDEHLGWEKPEFVIDYPASEASLAKLNIEGKAERFELFIAGTELANAFSELTDWQEQEKRLIREREERIKMEKLMYPVDNTFIEALKCGMPESGGIALGIDRLVMLLTDSRSLKEVILFPDD